MAKGQGHIGNRKHTIYSMKKRCSNVICKKRARHVNGEGLPVCRSHYKE